MDRGSARWRDPAGAAGAARLPDDRHPPGESVDSSPNRDARRERVAVSIERNPMAMTSIDEALRRIRRGEMVLVVDDEDRENEGDLTMAAEWVTPESVNFILRWARGLVCMPCDSRRLEALDLGPMVAPEVAGNDTAFTVSI